LRSAIVAAHFAISLLHSCAERAVTDEPDGDVLARRFHVAVPKRERRLVDRPHFAYTGVDREMALGATLVAKRLVRERRTMNVVVAAVRHRGTVRSGSSGLLWDEKVALHGAGQSRIFAVQGSDWASRRASGEAT
jgi:hypothetical protein